MCTRIFWLRRVVNLRAFGRLRRPELTTTSTSCRREESGGVHDGDGGSPPPQSLGVVGAGTLGTADFVLQVHRSASCLLFWARGADLAVDPDEMRCVFAEMLPVNAAVPAWGIADG